MSDSFSTIDPKGQLAMAQIQGQLGRLKNAETSAKQGVSDTKEFEKASNGFEALLLHQMLKSLWSTVDEGGLLSGSGFESGIYRDMLNQAIADSVSEGRGIGVKESLRRELLRHESAEPVADKPTEQSDIKDLALLRTKRAK